MKTNKLSLVRETILPLSSDELSQVAGGINFGDLTKPQSGISQVTQTVVSCGPLPRPTITSGPRTGDPFPGGGVSRQVSGLSNAF